ncbi:polysaccharide deacetylase family protein [Streptomyces sp. CNQ085]|uniref:polysaccharide deacetylase family protein n=1 Tax=Streptomyces sp. CNQ085 TaxID=2886944 RepID=UPI001F514F08|nr:polysaccharide deacetylase family protein [Streptomyces sp. CNQ085]MCI0383732.1 polysaccharide deacetylase family protein [Streptomyces sp. CNQ085]
MRHIIRGDRAALAAIAIVLAGCSATAGPRTPAPPDDRAPKAAGNTQRDSHQNPQRDRSAGARDGAGKGAAGADPAAVGANELGAVPVLMYHRITEDPQIVDDRTPQEFRAELERLAREGYVPVTAREFTGGEMDIPAGTHPVVLTFDDSTPSQFRLDADGRPAPGTAVDTLLDVAGRHPGFRPVATFFVNADPFGEPGGRKTLKWLDDHGFEIGNHTLEHSVLGEADAAMVQWDIASNQWLIDKALPDSPVVSMALPYGSMPRDRQLALTGEYGGVRYRHQGVYLAGGSPAPSPYSADLDSGAIPRIRSQAAATEEGAYGSEIWLDKLGDGAIEPYTSDGNPETVSFPREQAHRLAFDHQEAARPY